MNKFKLVIVAVYLANMSPMAAFADKPLWSQDQPTKNPAPPMQKSVNQGNGPKKFFGWTRGKHLGWAKYGKHLGTAKK